MAIKFSEMKELLKDTDTQTIKLSDPVYNSCMRQLTQNIVYDNPSAGKISFDILNKMKLQNKLSMVQLTYFDFIEFREIGFDKIYDNNNKLENLRTKYVNGEDILISISTANNAMEKITKKFIEYNPCMFINKKYSLDVSYIYVSDDLATVDELKPVSVHKQNIESVTLKYILFPYMSASKFFSKLIIYSCNKNDSINLICFCKKPTDSTKKISKTSTTIYFNFKEVMTYNVVHNFGDIVVFKDIFEFEKNDNIQILDETFKFI